MTRDRQGSRRKPIPDQRKRAQSVVYAVVALEVPRGKQPGSQLYPLSITESRKVHDVRNHARTIAVAGERASQVLRRDHDLVSEAHPRMNEDPPAREVIVRFAAMVVEHEAFAEESCREHRRDGAEEK